MVKINVNGEKTSFFMNVFLQNGKTKKWAN